MTLQTLVAIVGVATPALVAIIWAVRLEGRINTQEAMHVDGKQRLERIEMKVDRLIERVRPTGRG